MNPYSEGFHAAKNGEPRSKCPYTNPMKKLEWERGHGGGVKARANER